ncbi:MAG: AAA family ATPase, partial [Fibromonadaceae bacterium]|nr:AAA family ATPase [Fibromonadaceae bacterium]
MIRKVARLEHVGKFSSLTQETDFQYGTHGAQNCNIVFGFNGSGKTTLSNAITFFADKTFIGDDEKTALFEDIKSSAAATVELELQDRNQCKYPANKHSKSIYVFNSNFIVTHVFDGAKGKLKKFLNTSGEIKNAIIEELNKKIMEMEAEKKKLEGENENFEEKIKTINKAHSSNFNKTLTDKNKKLTSPTLSKEILPTETIDDLQQKLTDLAADYDLSKKQQDLTGDLAALGQLVFQKCDIDLSEVSSLLNKSVQQLSKEVIEAKIKEVKDLFADEVHKQSV